MSGTSCRGAFRCDLAWLVANSPLYITHVRYSGEKMHHFQRRKTFLVRSIQGTPPQKMFSLLVKISIERFLRRNEGETMTNFELLKP